MRLLLDTHVLIWALTSPDRIGPVHRDEIEDPANDVFFSAASIWEIAIKAGLGRADFVIDPALVAQAAVEAGFVELPIRAAVAMRVAKLPRHHRDPFDRLLVAQALAEPALLYTMDPVLAQYSDLVRQIGP